MLLLTLFYREMNEHQDSPETPKTNSKNMDSEQTGIYSASDKLRANASRLIKAGDIDSSRKLLEEGCRSNPNDAKIKNNLGQLMALCGDTDAAYMQLLEAVAIDGAIDVAWLGLIKIAISRKTFSDAIALIERAKMSGIPENTLTPYNLFILNQLGMFSASRSVAERHMPDLSFNEMFITEYLVALAHLEDFELGINVAKNFLKAYPGNIDVSIQLALLLQQAGDSAEGLRLLASIKPETSAQTLNVSQAQVTMYEDCGMIDSAVNAARICFENGHDIPRNAQLLFSLFANRLEFESAWRYHKYRWLLTAAQDTSEVDAMPEWQPGDSSACVYIYCEQGLGDQVIAYKILLLYTIAFPSDNVFFLEVDSKLCPVLPSTSNVIVLARKSKAIENCSLYSHTISMCTLIEKILTACELNILFGDLSIHRSISKLASDMIAKLKLPVTTLALETSLGLSWRSSNPQVGKDQSIEVRDLLDVLYNHGCSSAISLQYHPSTTEQDIISKHPLDVNLPNVNLFTDLASKMRIISSLDNVFTVSTLAAHLCGLMGVSTDLFISPGRAKLWYWNLKSANSSLVYPNIAIHEKTGRLHSFLPLIRDAVQARGI